MRKIRMIGDVHGNMKAWRSIIDGCSESIQVGDFGAGFVPIPDPQDVSLSHRFIRGNHDDPRACRLSSRWIEDGTFEEDGRIMFVGGALSIDKNMRTPMRDWWPDEELSYQEFDKIINKYEELKPDIMVTHDIPRDVYIALYQREWFNSITGNALQVMFEIHKPKFWFAGHHHEQRVKVIDGCNFIVLGINEYFNLTI